MARPAALAIVCSASLAETTDTLVVFGISGDLAKKMTFEALYQLERRGDLACRIVGVAIDGWDDDALRAHARKAIAATVSGPDPEVVERLCARLSYVAGDYTDDDTFKRLGAALGQVCQNPVFYLAIPPSLFAEVVRRLGAAGLTEGARVMIEKPFGHDLKSAQELNRELLAVLDESQILRTDHFLGKEPVMDILYLRFANVILEPVWNYRYVDSIQITLAEDFGVEDRGSFYDAVGALRDVVQNHLLQVLALVAMEPPSAGPTDPDAIRDRKSDFFRAIPAADPGRYVRGQYAGYREVDGVAPESETETFVALRLMVENWRWADVPIFIRAGKGLPVEATEVRIVFQAPPRLGIGGRMLPDPDELILRIKPAPGAELCLMAKRAGEDQLNRVHLDLLFESQVGDQPEPYERLLRDALRGNLDLFPNQNAIEQTWRIVQPLLDEPPPVEPYEPGTWGPVSASQLLTGRGGWRKPWLPES
jgi:glucose-6-phosphate 1-dehydrogenase